MNPCRRQCPTLFGRLVLLFLLMAGLVVLSVGSSVVWGFRNHFENGIRPHLMQYLAFIQEDIGSPPDYAKAKTLAEQLPLNIHYEDATTQWSTNGTPSDLNDIHFYRQFREHNVEFGFGHRYDQEYLIARHPDYTLAFSIKREHSHWALVFPLVVTLAMLLLLYHATRRLFSPLGDIKEGISRIGAGELSHRIAVKRHDELGELGTSINAMAEDIEQMLEAKRQLLLAISHELRTPLTRTKVAVELIDDETQRSQIHQDLNEMETLIEELLETERLSTRHHILNKASTVLQPLIRELVDEQFGDQISQNLLTVDMPAETITLMLDQARIKLLLKNILGNALQHNPDHTTPVQLSLNQTDASVVITVRDFGQGIEPQHLSHLTEPFYRTDAARQRQTGGYGLGLYLCKVITQAHGGHLKIDSTPGQGTTVSISLPLTLTGSSL